MTPSQSPAACRADQTSPDRRIVTIEPSSGWSLVDLGEIWRFRDLFRALVKRDVTLRYRQTALGVGWVVLQPLLTAGVLTFVFSRVAQLDGNGVPYYLVALTGMVLWTLFSGILTRSSGSLVSNAALLGKVYFPRSLLPVSAIGSAMVDGAVGTVLVLLLAGTASIFIGPAVALVPVWLLLASLLALGPGLMLSTLTASYRDVAYVVPVAVQALLFASPVAYPLSAVPERYQTLYGLNPLVAPLEGLRFSLVGGAFPKGQSIISCAAFVAAALVLGSLIFRRYERKLADVI